MGDDSSASLITVGVIFMIVAIALGHALNIYKIGFIHESGLYITLGLFGGALWLLVGPSDVVEYSFSPDMFFDVVLPPIIFSASYNLKRKQFINNFAPIMVLAIIGAIINFLLMVMVAVGLGGFDLEESECMLFAATMSATDGIAVVALIDAEAYPTIFGTLIGEGCINDAVAIILYSSIDSLSGSSDTSFGFTGDDLGKMFIKVCITASISITIGVSVGLLSALYFKFVRMQPTPKTELTLVFLFGYLSYSISDLTGESGIIGVFFCGVVMSHYTFHSLTHESQEASQEAFEAISYAGETFIYISLGFYTFSYTDSANWSASFLVTMLSVLLIGRVFVVGICVLMINLCKPRDKWISIKSQFVLWWGGIVRGAICFALSLRKTTEHSPILITTTFAIVIITTFGVGSLTETFLICIGMKDPDVTAESKHIRKDTALHEIGQFKRWVIHIDENYIKPIFGGRKRKIHELSIDNPDFKHHLAKYHEKEFHKAKEKLWASAGPTTISAAYQTNIGGSPPTMHSHPQSSPKGIMRSPQNNQYQNYETVRTIGKYTANQNSPYSFSNHQVGSSPHQLTNSLPGYQIHEEHDEETTDDDIDDDDVSTNLNYDQDNSFQNNNGNDNNNNNNNNDNMNVNVDDMNANNNK